MKIKDRIAALRRTYPRISIVNARYLHATAADEKKKGKTIVVWIVMWSDDGRVSLHRTDFARNRAMTVIEWAGWLQVNMALIMVNSVLPYANRSFGATWNIDRMFGWHFAPRKKAAR
jgi:hypothetical protein